MSPAPTPPVPNEEIVETYDRLAAPYDRLLSPIKAGTRTRALDALSLSGSETVVEVGCGPGHALVALAERVGPGGSVVGLDAAPTMVARARRRVAGEGTHDRIDVLLADATSPPIRADVADVVFVEDTLELFSPDELACMVDELRRILRPDGRLCVVTMERAGAEDDRFVRAYDWLYENVPGYGRFGCRPIYATRALEVGGFAIDRRERARRGVVWPVDVLIASPTG